MSEYMWYAGDKLAVKMRAMLKKAGIENGIPVGLCAYVQFL